LLVVACRVEPKKLSKVKLPNGKDYYGTVDADKGIFRVKGDSVWNEHLIPAKITSIQVFYEYEKLLDEKELQEYQKTPEGVIPDTNFLQLRFIENEISQVVLFVQLLDTSLSERILIFPELVDGHTYNGQNDLLIIAHLQKLDVFTIPLLKAISTKKDWYGEYSLYKKADFYDCRHFFNK
jgi:hypothetical protein